MKKLATLSLAAALALSPTVVPAVAQAKSVKWYCVALNPATPWVQTCYSSTSRP